MKETLAKISERTGFSIATISRVLNGKADKYRISKKTAEIILNDAYRSSYLLPHIAQNLRKPMNNSIGLLLPSISNPYFSEMASHIVIEAKKRNCVTVVIDTMENENFFFEGIRELMDRNVDGIIAVPCGTDSRILDKIYENGLPTVLVDRYYEKSNIPYVTCNNYKGGLMATKHLISNGHKNIVCIQGEPDSMPNKDRVMGYITAMEEAGLKEFISIVGNEFSVRNGYLETRLLLGSDNTPTAIFALSNTITLGAIKAIKEASLKIPEDISMISFDNYRYMDFMEPPITRISQPVEDMASFAVKILFEQISNHSTNANNLKFAPSLISAESVKNPRSSIL